MPPIFQTAELPRHGAKDSVLERFAAIPGASRKSQRMASAKDGRLFESRTSAGCEQLSALANLEFQHVRLPRCASQGYAYHNIYWIPIRLQDSERLLATRIVWGGL